MKSLLLGPGMNGAVAWSGDQIRVAWQHDSVLFEARFSAELEPVGVPEQEALSASAAACPCFVTDTTGDVVLAFKDGAPHYQLVLRRGRERPILGLNVQGFVASRGEQLSWQEATGSHSWRVRSLRSLADQPETLRASDDAEGIAHINEQGWPMLRYEHRFSNPLGTMPAVIDYAEFEALPEIDPLDPLLLRDAAMAVRQQIILCESEDLGLIGRWGNLPGWLSVLPGEYLSDPRAALSADGQRLAVTGWGPGGVWLASLTREDLGLPHVARIGRPCWVGIFKGFGFGATT